MMTDLTKIREECGTCRFSKIFGADLYCLRYPPTMFVDIEPDVLRGGAPRMSRRSTWPNVQKTFWCGEYQGEVKD
jgi:hypothetical protein